jgi:orotidine-5'-phosphate decarboxylase
MYDIGETVRRGITTLARRGVSLVTVHGDAEIMRAAVAGRDEAGVAMQIFAVSVLTSLDDAAVAAMGYGVDVAALVALRVRAAAAAGCDGVIASPTDRPDKIRRLAEAPGLLVATPGIRLAGAATDDHKRPGAPDTAIEHGADYLVVGRPITQAADPAAAAEAIVDLMRAGQARRGARPA